MFLDTALNPQPAVLLFFVLSGFVLGCLLDKSAVTSLPSYARYLFRRLFRLAPASWASVLFAAMLAGGAAYSLQEIFEAAIFVSFQPNAVLWTMQIELLASAVLPLLFWISRRCGFWINAAVFALLAFATLSFSLPLFVQFLVFFHAGLLVSHVPEKWPNRISALGSVIIILSAIAILWLPEFIGGPSRPLHYSKWQHWLWSEILPTFLMVYLVVVRRAGPLHNIMEARLFRFLGTVSFGIYLLHLPVLYATVRMLHGLHQHDGLRGALIALILTVLFTIPLAYLLHRFIERPCIEIGRKVSGIGQTSPIPNT